MPARMRASRHKSKLITIDDILAVDAVGKVIAKASTQTIIANWLDIVLPRSASVSEYQFPTPAGTRAVYLWSYFDRDTVGLMWKDS